MRQLPRRAKGSSNRMLGLDDLRFLVKRTPKMRPGQMLGYLFRRFGYPERGWDGYKEMCCYALTTPHPRLALMVRLTACPEPYLNLSLLTDEELHWEIRGDKARAQWRAEMVTWFEAAQQYPDWLDDVVVKVAAEHGITEGEVTQEDRRLILFEHGVWFMGPGPEDRPKHYQRVGELLSQIWKDYEKVCPRPRPPKRSQNWRAWPDSDPLKAMARAAEIALRDLSRPVHVRDGAVDPYSPSSYFMGDRRGVREARSAGYAPFGAYTNAWPEEVCELAAAVGALSSSPKRALAKATKLLREAIPASRRCKSCLGCPRAAELDGACGSCWREPHVNPCTQCKQVLDGAPHYPYVCGGCLGQEQPQKP